MSGYSKDRGSLQKLLQVAKEEFPEISSFPEEILDQMRNTRNRIVHYGFTPRDDKECAMLLLSAGFPFLKLCYDKFFHFSFEKALSREFSRHLHIASEVFERIETLVDVDPTYCLSALSHQVRWSVRESYLSHWEIDSMQDADGSGAKWNSVELKKKRVEQLLDPCWAFNCPVCGGVETFVCELANDYLIQHQIRLLRGMCADCNLHVPSNALFLADTLCREQVHKEKENIFREYGINY